MCVCVCVYVCVCACVWVSNAYRVVCISRTITSINMVYYIITYPIYSIYCIIFPLVSIS